MSKEDLIVTRNGVPFEDQMEGIRQFKEAAFKAAEKARLPQDVEEFIAESAFYAEVSNVGVPAIAVDDLRQWMTGHVRVPVETMQAIQAGFHEAATEVLGWGAYASEYFQKKHGLTDSAAVFTQMADDIGNLLSASKGE